MKYVLLNNYEFNKDKKIYKRLLELIPETKIVNYGVLSDGKNREINQSWKSVWIPEDKFLVAWTFMNHRFLQNGDSSFEEGFEYYNKHLSDSDLYKDENDLN